MRRVLCVCLTNLAIDLLARRDRRTTTPRERAALAARPTLVVAAVRQRQVVVACCVRAARAGVRPGMVLADARAVLSNPRVVEHDPDRMDCSLRALAVWARRFSPTVAPDPPDGLTIDVTGCARLFGGEPTLIARARRELQRTGFSVRLAIGPTIGCAWACARFGEDGVQLTADRVRTSLAPLPIAALRLDARTCDELAELGLDSIGDLMRVPRRTIPSRFGSEILMRLDQAMGEAIETVEPVRLAPEFAAERVFDGPTTRTDAIEMCARELLTEVAASLRATDRGARRIELELERVDLPVERIVLTMTRPTRDARSLWSMARPKLERTHLGHGVERIRVSAWSTARVRHAQRIIGGGNADEGDRARAAAETIDALVNRLGAERVRGARLVESHVPERACSMGPLTLEWAGREEPGTHTREASVPREAGEAQNTDPQSLVSGAERQKPRPSVLLDRPVAVRVVAVSPDGPVCSVRTGGREHAVVRTIGPERIGPEWWRGGRATRDYFRLQLDDGRWAWIFRAGRAWWLHGWW